jgi:hypothetical protein
LLDGASVAPRAAADRILARERRQRVRGKPKNEQKPFATRRRPEQWNARRAAVAQQLGVHPSQTPDEHVDYLFDRLGTAFMQGYKQTFRARSV